MSPPRPTDKRKDEMTRPPSAWPQTDEAVLQQRSDELKSVQRELVEALEVWRSRSRAVFNQQGWYGSASTAAETKVDTHLETMKELGRKLGDAVDFFDDAVKVTTVSKEAIVDIADAAQQEIDALVKASEDDGIDRTSQIEGLVEKAFWANSRIVTAAAASLGSPGHMPEAERPEGPVGDEPPMSHFVNNLMPTRSRSDDASPLDLPPQAAGAVPFRSVSDYAPTATPSQSPSNQLPQRGTAPPNGAGSPAPNPIDTSGAPTQAGTAPAPPMSTSCLLYTSPSPRDRS